MPTLLNESYQGRVVELGNVLKKENMDKIIITDLEMREPIKGFFGIEYKNPILNKNLEDMRHVLSPNENKMRIANERAGVKDNLLWHGWIHRYLPEKREWIFIKP